MKSGLFMLAGCFSCNLLSHGQADSIPRHIYLKTVITDIRSQSHQGYFNSITDSAVEFSAVKSLTYAYPIGSPNLSRIAVPDIESVSVKRRGSAGRGAGFGALIGAGLGTLIGYATYKNPAPNNTWDLGPGFDALGGACIGALSGSAIGLTIGLTAKKTFIIKGRQDKYRYMQSKLRQRLIRTMAR